MNEKGEGKYTIVVPPKAAESVTTHMNIYSGKELLVPVEGIKGVAEYIFKRRWDEMGMNTEINTLLESLKSSSSSKIFIWPLIEVDANEVEVSAVV